MDGWIPTHPPHTYPPISPPHTHLPTHLPPPPPPPPTHTHTLHATGALDTLLDVHHSAEPASQSRCLLVLRNLSFYGPGKTILVENGQRHSNLSEQRFVRATICQSNDLSEQRFVRATICQSNDLSEQRFVRATICLSNDLLLAG